MAELVADSMRNRNKKEDDVSLRTKSNALEAMRGFGLYIPYICAEVAGKELKSAAKRASMDQRA